MANVNKDFPRGLWPLTEGAAARPRMTEYTLTAASTPAYVGQPLRMAATGMLVAVASGTAETKIVGVLAASVATNASDVKVLVWDDPFQEFGIQADAAIASTDVGTNVAMTGFASGNTTGNHSICETTGTPATTSTLPLRILGKIDRAGGVNTWATHVDLRVRFNAITHFHAQSIGI